MSRRIDLITGLLILMSAVCFIYCSSSRTYMVKGDPSPSYLVKDGTRPRNFTVFLASQTSCEEVAARYISRAESTVIIHTHSVTSRQIADVLFDAWSKRNVNVELILYDVVEPSLAAYLAEGGVKVYHDTIPTPVSDNIMIIDNEFVFTGTYGFASTEQDTDYFMVIKDPELVRTFRQNWMVNRDVAVRYSGKK